MAYTSWKQFTEEVRRQTAIEDLIEETGHEYRLARKPGIWIKGVEHDSLNVNVVDGCYKWWGENEGGDIFNWVMSRQKIPFAEAVIFLAKRANMEIPQFEKTDNADRDLADVWDLAQQAMSQFLRDDADAWAYVTNGPTEQGKPRYFSSEIVKRAGLGFSGKGDKERLEMLRIFKDANINPESPAAVAVLGYKGDVLKWGKRWNIEPNANWVGQAGTGYISGLMTAKRLVYPHFVRGHVVYFSARNILGSERDRNGNIRKSYNLPKALVGESAHQVYFNALFTSGSESVIIVEGPGDAIALEHMGQPAVALLGLGTKDMDTKISELRKYSMRGNEKADRTVYIGIDEDSAGKKFVLGKDEDWPILPFVGPMARLLSWDNDDERNMFEIRMPNGEKRFDRVHDANDYLTAYEQWKETTEKSAAKDSWVQPPVSHTFKASILDHSTPLVLAMADWSGGKRGVDKEKAQRATLAAMTLLDDVSLATYRQDISQRMKINLREMNNLLKAINSQAEINKSKGEPIYTWGGFIDGWLIEYLYDIETHTASLAWKDPDGKVGCGEEVQFEGKLYKPYPPNDALQAGAILFPSKLGEKKSIKELVLIVETYLKQVYLMPSSQMARLIAYWVIATWVYDSFETCIYLRATGGTGSGKSEMMKRIGLVCYRLMMANGAGSTSALFRSVERYKGVVFIDEADIQQSDTENDMVKFYNLGAMKNNPIWRAVEAIGPNGEKTWDAIAFQTFCPKLVAMRKEFKDDAIGSRSLTFKMQSRETNELIEKGIPFTITRQMKERAQAIRNLMVRWRLDKWKPEFEMNPDFYDKSISPRLNQVSGPMLSIAEDDPEQQEAIRVMLREYYSETIISQSMTLAARIIEAMWKIWQVPDLRINVLHEMDEHLMKIGDITKAANEIMNAMNETDDYEDEEDDKKGGGKRHNRELKPQKTGRVLREELQMRVSERRSTGFWVYFDEARLEGLSTKYGVNRQDFTKNITKDDQNQEKLI